MKSDPKIKGILFCGRMILFLYRSFTLIELLVVIAIIAILASLLLPTLKSAKQTASKISCLNNQKTVGMGAQMYADTYKFFPQATSATSGELGYHWYQKLYSEITGRNGRLMDAKSWNEIFSAKWSAKFYWCPSYRLSTSVNLSVNTIPYGMNESFLGAKQGRQKYPSRMILLGDSNDDGATMYVLGPTWLLGGERHNGQCNIIFGDGHAATGKPLEYHRRPSTIWGTMNYETGANATPSSGGDSIPLTSPFYQFMRNTWNGED